MSDSDSTANGSPSVEITLGRSGGSIITTGKIDAKAKGLFDADASTTSVAGGGASRSTCSTPPASMTPTVKATVAGGALIKSTGGTVTIDATAGQAPGPTSDGTFNASDTCPLDGGSTGLRRRLDEHASRSSTSTTPDRRRRGLRPAERDGHLPTTPGDQSDPNDRPQLLGSSSTGTTSLQLGVTFNNTTLGGTIDPVTDVIDFGTRRAQLRDRRRRRIRTAG